MREQDYELAFKDAVDDFDTPNTYTINVNTYRHALNQVFFPPTAINLQVYNKYNQNLSTLLEQWWDKISSSKKIAEHFQELEQYRISLKPGDLTLLGLITEGGKGMDTSNNGRFIGVLEGTKLARRVSQTRPVKLLEVISKYKIKEFKDITTLAQAKEYLESMDEKNIRELFEKLKGKYDRDIFGQGYLYRVIAQEEVAVINQLTDYERFQVFLLTNLIMWLTTKGIKTETAGI